MNSEASELSAQLLAWRRACGLTQTQAAVRIGTRPGTYIHWERGRRHPDAAVRRWLAVVMEERR